MPLPVVGSRYGFATYGWRSADLAGVRFTFSDFYAFLDAIGITSDHRIYASPANGGILNIRFPAVDTDIVTLGPITTNENDGKCRAIINPFMEGGTLDGVGTNIQLYCHTKATYLANNNNPGSAVGIGGHGQVTNGFFYAVGDSKGFAIFHAKYSGLNIFANQWSFSYFGYCDNPASVAYFDNNNYYPLDYIAYSNSNLGTPFGYPNTPMLKRSSKTLNPGMWGSGPAINCKFNTAINCSVPTPNASISDFIFLDDGVTDYGTNYPLGKARPFLLFTTQDLPINSLVRVEKPPALTPEDHFHIVVDKNGFGSTLMPIITERITMP